MSAPAAPQATPVSRATARAHPSLALIKYWGKLDSGVNIPATSSLAVTLAALHTTTTVSPAPRDAFVLNGEETGASGARSGVFGLLDRIWHDVHGAESVTRPPLFVESRNNFPTAAGLASSASGYAALTRAAAAAFGDEPSGQDEPVRMTQWSALARTGSGSAARSVWGGFTAWEAGATAAATVHDETWWPELRVVVLPLSAEAKAIGSREAMNRTRDTSPYYSAWVADAPHLFDAARRALAVRDLDTLGPLVRASYMRMFASMLGATPPIVYWLPASVATIHALEALRAEGVPAWETMDAGPQVKVITIASAVDAILKRVSAFCVAEPVVSAVGPAAHLVTDQHATA